MATKVKAKPKSKDRKPASKTQKAAKLLKSKSKRAPSKAAVRSKTSAARSGALKSKKTSSKPKHPVQPSASKPSATASAKKTAPKLADAPKSRPIAGALTAYEAGIKLMYTENYDKAITAFTDLIQDFPEEPEIQASA